MSTPDLETTDATISAQAARIAELEAANAVCRRDIEALMRSADSLEARNTELEAERDRLKENLAEEIDARAQDKIDIRARITELEAERNNYRDLNENLIDDLNRVRAGVWKLEAERDRLKENLAEEREACAQDAIDYAGIGWRSGAREGIAALIRARAALSDPSGE